MPQTKSLVVTVASIATAAGLLVWVAPLWEANQARLRAAVAVRSCAMIETEWTRNFPALVDAQRAYDKLAQVLSKYSNDTTEHEALVLLRGKRARDLNGAAVILQVTTFGAEGCGDAWPARLALVEATLAKSGPEANLTDDESDGCAARATADAPPDRDDR